MFNEDKNRVLAQLLLYEHKLRWRKTGEWMDTAKPEDELPNFPGLEYSSTEKKLIKETILHTTRKRTQLMAMEYRFIQPNEEDYRWSDLLGYPDVQQAIKESVGFSDEIWIDGALTTLLRMRPKSMIIRQIQATTKMQKTLLEGVLHVAMQTLANTEKAKHQSYKKRRDGKTQYPEECIKKAVEMYTIWESTQDKKTLKKEIIGNIKLFFLDQNLKQPSEKQIDRWVKNEKYWT